jgi:hypothetical protein
MQARTNGQFGAAAIRLTLRAGGMILIIREKTRLP